MTKILVSGCRWNLYNELVFIASQNPIGVWEQFQMELKIWISERKAQSSYFSSNFAAKPSIGGRKFAEKTFANNTFPESHVAVEDIPTSLSCSSDHPLSTKVPFLDWK